MHLPGLDEDHPTKLKLGGTKIGLDDGTEPARRDRFYFVGQAQVAKTEQAPTGADSDQLEWIATAPITQAAVVPEHLAADILEEHSEDKTGQIRLLSTEGEVRKVTRDWWLASRDALDAADDDGRGLKALCAEASGLVEQIRALDSDELTKLGDDGLADEGTVLEAAGLIDEAAGWLIASAAWCRRRLAEISEARYEAETAAKVAVLDQSGSVMTPAEIAEAKGSVIPTGDFDADSDDDLLDDDAWEDNEEGVE